MCLLGKYGAVVSFRMMGQRLVILNDVDVVREALNKEVFSGRPRNFINEVVAENKGNVYTDFEIYCLLEEN